MIILGEASYAFYLIHMSVGSELNLGLLSNGFHKISLALWIVGVIFLTAMAIGLNVMVETPARRYIRRWLMPRKKTSAPVGASSEDLAGVRAGGVEP
jgi:peptidoglycan/LPS O-acetylase OafA/YrhL